IVVGVVSMAEAVWQLEVEVVPPQEADAAEVAEFVHQLRRELLQTDVERVDLAVTGPPPAGAKAVAGVAVGPLLIGAGPPVSLRRVVAAVRSWVEHNRVRAVKMTLDDDVLEVTGISSEDQRRLIDAWLARHDTPRGV